MRKVVLLTLCLCLLAAPAWATFVDFSIAPTPPGTQGTTLTIGDLTITAKTTLDQPAGNANPSPPPVINPLLAGSAYDGTVFWGNLKKLDVGGGPDYIGLGVRSLTNRRSEGISGEGPGSFEALIFSFANPPGVLADSVTLRLVGINGMDS
jgi:hypothetical protein